MCPRVRVCLEHLYAVCMRASVSCVASVYNWRYTYACLLCHVLQGAALAAKFADPMTALTTLLGPELTPLGAAGTPLSAQVRIRAAQRDMYRASLLHTCLGSRMKRRFTVVTGERAHVAPLVGTWLCCGAQLLGELEQNA